jgi:hypothetical protein
LPDFGAQYALRRLFNMTLLQIFVLPSGQRNVAANAM